MKIQVLQPGQRTITIPFPNWLLFNPAMIRFGLRIGKSYTDQMPNIPPEAIDALCTAIRAVNKKYGTWELVRVESSGGERVIITI